MTESYRGNSLEDKINAFFYIIIMFITATPGEIIHTLTTVLAIATVLLIQPVLFVYNKLATTLGKSL